MKDAKIELRTTKKWKAEVERAAKAMGLTISQFVTDAVSSKLGKTSK